MTLDEVIAIVNDYWASDAARLRAAIERYGASCAAAERERLTLCPEAAQTVCTALPQWKLEE